jgi:hypothetical protein
MDKIDEAYVKRLRDLARECDSTGDMVGPNDFALSNQIWALVPALKSAARDWEVKHADGRG